MRKYMKLGSLTAGAGLVVGLGVIFWLRQESPQEVAVNSVGGSIRLDTGAEATPTPDPQALRVTEAGPGTVQGTLPASRAEAKPAPGAPEPTDFRQYEKYRHHETALFGDMVVGQGKEAAAGSKLTVKYSGWLIDGQLFDKSGEAGFSFELGAGRVIAGWEQGMMGMKVGGKRRLIVPPAAGYGAEANGPIPANSLLVFDVELLDVK